MNSRFSTYLLPRTRIRRRGIAGYRNLKMRKFFQGAALYVAVFFISALGYVWTRVQVMETGYRIRKLESKQEKLKEENRALAVEAATLRSPQRLGELASQMGLERPEQSQIYYLKK